MRTSSEVWLEPFCSPVAAVASFFPDVAVGGTTDRFETVEELFPLTTNGGGGLMRMEVVVSRLLTSVVVVVGLVASNTIIN